MTTSGTRGRQNRLDAILTVLSCNNSSCPASESELQLRAIAAKHDGAWYGDEKRQNIPPCLDAAGILWAAKEGLAPLLGAKLSFGEITVEDDGLRARLETAHRSTIARMTALDAVAEDFGAHMQEAGIAAMAIKGLALANTVYRRPGERIMKDIDVLVSPKTYHQVCRILVQAGGKRATGSHPFHSAILTKHGVVIEVHHAVARPDQFKTDTQGMLGRASVGRYGLLYPDPNDHIVILAIHLARNRLSGWARAVVDGLSLAECDGIEPKIIVERARAAKASMAVAVYLKLLQAYGLNGDGWDEAISRLGHWPTTDWLATRAQRPASGRLESAARMMLVLDGMGRKANWVAWRVRERAQMIRRQIVATEGTSWKEL